MSFFAPILHFQENTENLQPESTGGELECSNGRYCILLVHGFGSIFGQAFSTRAELRDILTNRFDNPTEVSRHLQGTVTVAFRDKQTNFIYVATDRFGAGKIFRWASPDSSRWAISSSLTDLVAFLQQSGVSVEKSLASAAVVGFVGYSGAISSSPYCDIDTVDQFHYLSISPDGRISTHEDPHFPALLDSAGLNYDQLLEQVASQVRESVATFSSYDSENYVCQLTGGLDSRSVFAALVSSGFAPRFTTYTYGVAESPDMVIAGQLSAQYGITQSTFSGMRSRVIPQTPADQSIWSLEQTGGLSTVTPVSLGTFPVPNSVVLSGGWGEMYRGGYPDYPARDASDEEKIRWAVNWILRTGSPYGPRIAYGGIFSEQMVDKARNYATTMLGELRDFGLTEDLLPEWMYLRWSTRFNVAETTRAVSPFAHRADPLCVSSMLPLIVSAPFEDRKSGAIQLDLIRTLSPGMERFPFEKPYLTAEYMGSRGIELASFSKPPTQPLTPSLRDLPYSIGVHGASKQTTDADKAEALRVKMPVRFITRAEDNRKRLSDYIASEPERISEVFDVSKLNFIADNQPRTRPEYRRLETLTSALDWFFKGVR